MMYELILLINRENIISQRKIASELNISLGKANDLVKSAISIGFITKETKGYKITKIGFEFLKNEINQKNNEKIVLNNELENKVISKAVILAAGYNNEFVKPIGALEIEGKSLIRRNVELLRSFNITEIFILLSQDSETMIQEFKDDDDIRIIVDEELRWFGNMKTLSLVHNIIQDDFLLIEGDLVLESKGIEAIINSSKRDCMLITDETGSGDEGFVQVKDGCLFKLSKDIHKFNRIDGEMV